MRTIRLFISHAWQYNGQYYKLIRLLKKRGYFAFFNHSVPRHDPLDFSTKRALEGQLANKMKSCHVVLVIAGVYASYSYWMQKEIEIAEQYGKPVLAIRPRGQINISQIVSSSAHYVVGWNVASIVDAIRTLAK